MAERKRKEREGDEEEKERETIDNRPRTPTLASRMGLEDGKHNSDRGSDIYPRTKRVKSTDATEMGLGRTLLARLEGRDESEGNGGMLQIKGMASQNSNGLGGKSLSSRLKIGDAEIGLDGTGQPRRGTKGRR
jgi:hypothetical protein